MTSGIAPALGLTGGQVETLLVTAGRAPSLHNSQPWCFAVTPAVIELYAERSRALPVIDPTGREMRIACGAALFNLRLALHGNGIRPQGIITAYYRVPGNARRPGGGYRTDCPVYQDI